MATPAEVEVGRYSFNLDVSLENRQQFLPQQYSKGYLPFSKVSMTASGLRNSALQNGCELVGVMVYQHHIGTGISIPRLCRLSRILLVSLTFPEGSLKVRL